MEGFLEGVRNMCAEQNILLLFDEVVTGFRLAYGGPQEYYGVIPFFCLPKALGGGSPIGAFGGRIDIMEWANEHRTGEGNYVWMASTLRCNPVLTVAVNATLSAFHQPGTYEKLHSFGQYSRDGLTRVLAEHELVAVSSRKWCFQPTQFLITDRTKKAKP